DAARGDRLRLAAVDGSMLRVVRLRQVDRHLVAADLDRQPDPARIGAVAVVVERALGAVDAVRDGGNGRALEALGLSEDLVARGVDRLLAVLGDDRLEPPLAGADARDLRAEVTDGRVREAAVATEQVGDVAPLDASVDDLHRPEPDPLLVDLGRVHRPAGFLRA